MIPLRTPFTALAVNEIFAVTDTSVQVILRPDSASATNVDVRVGERTITVDCQAGAGVAEIDGLTPDSPFRLQVIGTNGEVVEELSGNTLPKLGPATKIATISDVHLGALEFGPIGKISDHQPVPYPLRCGRAAIDEAVAWGAEVLVIKGDLTDTGARDQWRMAQELLDGIDIPIMITSGNHDVWGTREIMPAAGAASIGRSVEDVQTLDIGNARIVLVDTSIPGTGSGDLQKHRDLVRAAVDVKQPVLLCLHHHLQRTPVPWFWPPGIPPANAMPVVEELFEINPALMITSGHTHRNRRHRLLDDRITFTEVAATSDYPGVWAGYEISQDTIRQTVRRIASPDAISWTEATRAALGTIWPRWSQGRLDDRCVDVEIPAGSVA